MLVSLLCCSSIQYVWYLMVLNVSVSSFKQSGILIAKLRIYMNAITNKPIRYAIASGWTERIHKYVWECIIVGYLYCKDIDSQHWTSLNVFINAISGKHVVPTYMHITEGSISKCPYNSQINSSNFAIFLCHNFQLFWWYFSENIIHSYNVPIVCSFWMFSSWVCYLFWFFILLPAHPNAFGLFCTHTAHIKMQMLLFPGFRGLRALRFFLPANCMSSVIFAWWPRCAVPESTIVKFRWRK